MMTEHAGHGTELMKSMNRKDYDGVVIVSGDGLIYEVNLTHYYSFDFSISIWYRNVDIYNIKWHISKVWSYFFSRLLEDANLSLHNGGWIYLHVCIHVDIHGGVGLIYCSLAICFATFFFNFIEFWHCFIQTVYVL